MAGVGSKSTDEINVILKKLLPELDSKYAAYPMAFSAWYSLGEKGPKGEATWLESDDLGLKQDYVYGKGPGGLGYYHVLTKPAYTILYTRVSNSCPVLCFALTSSQRKALDEWDTARRIVHARYVSNKPDDQHAKVRQVEDAQGYTKGLEYGA